MANTRKIPPYDELIVEYDFLISQGHEKGEIIEILANKYNCHKDTVKRTLKFTKDKLDDNIPQWWLMEFKKERSDIAERIISGKHTVIVKQVKHKVIPASDVPRGYIH